MNWPSWWDWDLGFTPHLEMRMVERGFSEVELRAMFDAASKCVPGRQIVNQGVGLSRPRTREDLGVWSWSQIQMTRFLWW